MPVLLQIVTSERGIGFGIGMTDMMMMMCIVRVALSPEADCEVPIEE
jgi:hypothetical protein